MPDTIIDVTDFCRIDDEPLSSCRNTATIEAPSPGCPLDDIYAAIRQRVTLTEHQAVACTLWTAFTWFMDEAEFSPILNISSPVPRCGKTTLFRTIAALVHMPLATSNATQATLHRLEPGATLLIDEADTFLRSAAMTGVINGGHTRAAATVTRVEHGETRQFSTWHAKLLCGIGNLADTTRDRSIVIRLVRQAASVQRDRAPRSTDILLSQMAALKAWCESRRAEHAVHAPRLLDLGNERASDNWSELQRVAFLAGPDWVRRCEAAAQALTERPDALSDDDEGLWLLRIVRAAFSSREATRIWSSEMLTIVNSDADAPWASATSQHRLNNHRLAAKLKVFGVAPAMMRIGTETRRGYKLEDLQPVFDSYLEPVQEEQG